MNFFIGQRVRLIAVDNFMAAPYVGEETRITSDFFSEFHQEEAWTLDNGWCCVKCDADKFLSPIQPDGMRPSEFTTLHDLLNSLEGVAA
jgi:hypothetical protein